MTNATLTKRTLLTVTLPDSIPFGEGSGVPDAVRAIWDVAVNESEAYSGVLLYMLLSGVRELWLHTDASQNAAVGVAPDAGGTVMLISSGVTSAVLKTVVGLTKYLFNEQG